MERIDMKHILKKTKHNKTHKSYTILSNRHKHHTNSNFSYNKSKVILNSTRKEINSNPEDIVNDKRTKTKFSNFRNKQKKLHNRDISEKNQALNSASIQKENIQSSIQEEINQLKVLKRALKAQKKELKLTKKQIHKARKKNYGLISMTLIGLLITFSIFLFFIVKWLFHTWPNLQISELVYQAKVGVNGTSKDMITAFITQTIVPTLCFF